MGVDKLKTNFAPNKIQKMKKHTLRLTALFLILAFGQHALKAQCSGGQAAYSINANNIAAQVHTSGDLWFDGDANYELPIGSGVHALYAGGLWFGGIDPGGNLHVAAQTYGANSGNFEFWPGPIPNNTPPTSDLCDKFDRFFDIEKTDILAHIADWNDNGQIDGTPPSDILGWPAQGNPYFFDAHGFDLPFSPVHFAPFHDENQDGLYDPYDGDYPRVNGDKAVWWVFNDIGGIHANSQGLPIGMEVQAMAYAYNSDSESLKNTTFYDFRTIYWGNEPLNDFFIGLWVDPDLGCWSDDYIGSAPEENMGFVYNGDANDEDCSGLSGYGENIPVVGIKKIRSRPLALDTMQHFSYYFNQNSGASSGQTDPSAADQYYNYLRGLWKDGIPISQGGNGYDLNAPAYPFAFDGSEINGQPWTECTVNSTPSDRRFLMTYDGGTLNPGEINEFTFAVTAKMDVPHPCPDVSGLVDDMDAIADFDQQQLGAGDNQYLFPVAFFDGTKQPGSTVVAFTDHSYYNPTEWTWDFGDGNTSTDQNPSHTYADEGTYEVCLTAANTHGSGIFCKNINVVLPAAPTADFSFSANFLEVNFSDLSGNGPTEWTWDFGDGNTSSEQNPTHIYDVPGLYTVCLIASNAGGSDSTCQEVNLQPNAVNESIAAISMRLFPNPAQQQTMLQLQLEQVTSLDITLRNSFGQTTQQLLTRQQAMQGQLNIPIDLRDFPKGVYWLEVKSTLGARLERLVVQ